MPATSATTVEKSRKGEVPDAVVDAAVTKVLNAADHTREPVLAIEVRIELAGEPARARPALAEVTVDVNGAPVRAHVAAETLEEAVDFVVDRLARRIQRHEQRLHQLDKRHRTGDSGDGEWRHGDLPTARPDYFPRPYEQREVTRTKSFALEPVSVERAIVDLEVLDHVFYLFVDSATGADCIVAHVDGGEIVFRSADPAVYGGASPIDGLAFDQSAPSTSSLVDAKEQLDVGVDRYVFFVDEESGRANVLYRRYDGHYGLVQPA